MSTLSLAQMGTLSQDLRVGTLSLNLWVCTLSLEIPKSGYTFPGETLCDERRGKYFPEWDLKLSTVSLVGAGYTSDS